MENGKTSYSVYTNKAAEAEFSDVIHLYSSGTSMAESEYVASGHIPFLPGNRSHNPACAFYRFSNVSFEYPYIIQNRYSLY